MVGRVSKARSMRLAASVVVTLAVVFQPASVRAALQWSVDDTCTVSTVGAYFYVGGPAGFGIHSGGYNNCHLYNHTHAGGNPIHWAHYLLPVSSSYNGWYEIWSVVNCEHDAPRYKYYLYPNGSNNGIPSAIRTTGTHVPCGGAYMRVPDYYFSGSLGASIRLVDNVGVAPETQQVDWHLFKP